MTQHLFLKTLPLTFYPLLQRINMVGNLYLACIFIVLQYRFSLGFTEPIIGRQTRFHLGLYDSHRRTVVKARLVGYFL